MAFRCMFGVKAEAHFRSSLTIQLGCPDQDITLPGVLLRSGWEQLRLNRRSAERQEIISGFACLCAGSENEARIILQCFQPIADISSVILNSFGQWDAKFRTDKT